ncbi:uncharacterized protein CANTADRAFT_55629 [Suhomyces tanzawaensis NRRL Y-17324]|uniref:Large ribosomal subunit protein uL23m n=1 Tax=Suhomyces tanzawaensis NRRL Y-17324 TaxID=984487 RepID=A0A1E4SDW2_9ASCO|nr:uncharacterized protein CANTADRAFT_55629 [Suhomyces tanzawaensis NRRL Y-17324]ODV77582.1 hypothetical protein CANTADRAFT_55629 [Suhomyces tanzawaensis NRRL Y-17324]
MFLSNIWKRALHYKQTPKSYPKINVKDVVLDKPRVGFRKEREPLISQSVTDTLFPNTEIKKRYIEAGKPVPIKYRSNSDAIARRNYEKYQEEVMTGQPHFRVGENKIYFPSGRICLLRPNAKHTPYQAKFLVPKSMNKMDLRDYLWNVYGLRALNVTVQLLHGRFQRDAFAYARYRLPQYKKMTVDMAEPFIWPEVSPELVEQAENDYRNEVKVIELKNGRGSDLLKPIEGFDGMYASPELPDAFVSRKWRKQGETDVQKHTAQVEEKTEKDLVGKFLGL